MPTHLIQDFLLFFLVLMRFMGMVALMPVLGQMEIPGRVKAMVALMLSVCLAPTIGQLAGVQGSPSFLQVFFWGVGELLVGLFIGGVARALLSILDMAGALISFQLNLSNATLFNPAQATQGALVSVFLTMCGVVTFLSLDLHHLVIKSGVASYHIFPLCAAPMVADFSASFSLLMSKIFICSVQLAMPFLIVGIVMQLAFGFLNRLMPQMHIFFVTMPAQIGIGLMVFMVVASAIILRFAQSFDQEYRHIFHMDS
jgi:flagellar biosynthetic protein FliR